MNRGWGESALVLLVVLTVVLMPVTTVGIGTVQATSHEPTTFEATDSINVWERAPLPLRLSNDDAAKTITNGALNIEYKPDDSGPIPAREGRTGVYTVGTPVTATFESVTGAGTSDFNDKDTQLVVARLEPDAEVGDVPMSMDAAQSLLTQDNANANATFEVKDTDTITNGKLTPEVTFDQSGSYVLFLATTENGQFSETDGDLSVSGDVTIVGLDHAIVESAAAQTTIDTNDVDPGDDISVTVSNLPAEETNVTVLVYDRSTWTDSETTFVVNDTVDRNFTAENLTIKHSIAEVNGVADFEGPVTVLGTTFNDASVSGTVALPTVIDTVVTETDNRTSENVTKPHSVATDSTVLDASMAGAVNVTGPTTLTLETFKNWSAGTYQYVVLAGGSNTGDIRTDTGTLTIGADEEEPPEEDPGPDPDPDPEPPVSPGPDPEPPKKPGNVTGGGEGASVERTNGQIVVNLPNASARDRVVIDVPEPDAELEATGQAMTQLSIDFTEDTSGGLTIDSAPDTTGTPPVAESGDLGYFRITHEFSDSSVESATFTFQVTKQKLADRGLAAADVALYRLEDDGWNELPTSVVDESETAYTFETTSPGLSLYSISQKNAAQPRFQVTTADVETTEVTAGDAIDVTATIENTGSSAGDFTANLTVDGEVVATETVRVPAGGEETVSFTHTFDEAGTYDVGVSGTSAGTVTVTAQETTTTQRDTTTGTTTGPEQPGGGIDLVLFGGLVVVIGLVVGLYFYYKREE